MYKSERTLKEERYGQAKQNPSFSSSLLDKIYRSIDEPDPKGEEDLRFYGEAAMARKQSIRDIKKCGSRSNKCATVENLTLHRGVFVSNKVGDDGGAGMRQIRDECERKQRRDRDRDALFLSSTSSSSDSSSGGFSSSDTESMYGVVKTRSSCFA